MYRKLKADLIFNGFEFLEPDNCLIIKENGEVVAIEPASGDEEVYEGILLPGLINCHCHIELSHLFEKIPQHTGLVEFVMQVMRLRFATEDEKLAAMQHAMLAMEAEGIVAVGDICNTADSVALKKESKIKWRNFIELSGFVDATAQARFEAGLAIAQQFEEALIVPHAPYSVSKKLFALVSSYNQQLISIHNQETQEEDEFLRNKSGGFLKLYEGLGVKIDEFKATGKASIYAWLEHFQKQQIVSVHNTFTTSEDLKSALHINPNIFFCLCVNANLYIENNVPDIDLFLKHGAQLVIGTDSLASNQRLSLLEEMRSIQKHFPHIKLEQILQWSTSNGAKALQFHDLGSFEKGRTPGVVLMNNAQQLRIHENTNFRRII